MGYFKGDDLEKKVVNAALPVFEIVSHEKDQFFEGAYDSVPFGELLYDSKRAPLTTSIPFLNFKDCFTTLFNAFPLTGTFEVFLSVFRAIFGDDVEVTFTTHDPDDMGSPPPGALNIDIVATGLDLSEFIARAIVEGDYVFDEVIDDEGDNIIFQGVRGFQTQYELEQMLFEMVVAGIFVNVSLEVGE